MRIGFYGAAGEVTGSNFVLETATAQIIIDCGMFQGFKLAEKSNYEPFAYDPTKVHAMILTHAHLDHCGRIPKLWKEGYRNPIYCTPATRDIAELVMKDAAQVMLYDIEDDATDQEPLYLAVDVANAMTLFEPVEYHERTEIAPDIFATFYDAGHILGAACVLIEADGKKIIFSGDIGNHPVPIIRNPEPLPTADYVVMESTYGGRTHDDPSDRKMKLRRVIRETAAKGGTLLIPAFAVERTQEILYELSQLAQEHAVPNLPVFLDSPLAIDTTNVYHRYPQYYDDDALLITQNGGDFLSFPQLKVTESADQSREIKQFKGAKIIIAGSGMMEGGRIVHHAKDFLPDPATTLLFVGYQAEGTLGRFIFDGKRKISIKHQVVPVRAHVAAIGAYSAHADQPGLKQWLDAVGNEHEQPEHVFLVHGEQNGAAAFAKFLGKEYTVTVPAMNEIIELS